MKKIEAIFRYSRIEEVKKALANQGVKGLLVYEIKGLGEQTGEKEYYRGKQYSVDYVPKLKLECIMADDKVDECLHAIAEAARTGKIGDGKIIVTPVEQIMRIRTGEIGDSAV